MQIWRMLSHSSESGDRVLCIFRPFCPDFTAHTASNLTCLSSHFAVAAAAQLLEHPCLPARCVQPHPRRHLTILTITPAAGTYTAERWPCSGPCASVSSVQRSGAQRGAVVLVLARRWRWAWPPSSPHRHRSRADGLPRCSCFPSSLALPSPITLSCSSPVPPL